MSGRFDSIGIFWQDIEEVRVPKPPPPKRTPPARTWEEPDYLPDLDEALAFAPPLMTEEELFNAFLKRERLVFDVEIYPNYLLIAFRSLVSGKVIYFEKRQGGAFDKEKVLWIMQNFITVGFNTAFFDVPMVTLAIAGLDCDKLKLCADRLIKGGEKPFQVLRSFKVKKGGFDNIDLIKVAPLAASLKLYNGRLHGRKMQDLPFKPDVVLTENHIAIVRHYCIGSDLDATALLYSNLEEQVKLRERIGEEYRTDLRSKSDAQVAESVIATEVLRRNFHKPERPEIAPGTAYKYKLPRFIEYKTELLNGVARAIAGADFVVGAKGAVISPPELQDASFQIGETTYRMGIGGLHSCEKRAAHYADDEFVLLDRDVTSYYPSIILNLELYPQHIGPSFLDVYRDLVRRRVAAKKAGDNITADALKISVNGIFGKLGNKWSVVYSPDLLMQVTVTGQLSLLMLIEAIELAGISVVSANTDGFVIKCPRARREELNAIVAAWEKQTNFVTEETEYDALFSRDVNNYIAVKPDGKTKTKGAYANPWSDKKLSIFRFHKNPMATITIDAALKYLTESAPISETIRTCRDMTKFCCVRTVKGGAVKDGFYLGKAIRWYYAKGYETGEIVYAMTGNKVPRSEGACPLLVLPDEFPEDVDFDWYESEANEILKQIGFDLEGLVNEEVTEDEDDETEVTDDEN